MKTLNVPAVMLATLALTPGAAHAQTASSAQPTAAARRGFVDVSAGFVGESRTLQTSSSFPLFGELAAVATSVRPAASPLVDARLGFLATSNIGVALAVAGARGESAGVATASVPSPIRFASPSIVNLDAQGLKRREIDYHVQLVWRMPLTDRVNVGLFGGPSVIRVQQAFAGVTLASGTQTPTVTAANATATAKGGNAGLEIAYAVSDRYGVGVFGRYVRATADFPGMTGVRVGGVQAGAGLRVRF